MGMGSQAPAIERAQIQVRVLVLDSDVAAAEPVKRFCEQGSLLPLRVQPEHLMPALRSSIDLGAILLHEGYEAHGLQGLALARELNRIRPELPIFLRTEAPITLDETAQRFVRHAFVLAELEALQAAVQASLFSLVYPEALVRGISELTLAALRGQFRGIEVVAEAPMIVRDRLIHGEVYSLIPLEANWCRGYMMLQIEENGLRRLQGHQLAGTDPVHQNSIRAINNLFSETTNLIWGAFKNRFMAHDAPLMANLTQVPIVINHVQRYISFGSEDPQLCFRYFVWDNALQQGDPIELHQRFVFNLNWTPELFRENQDSLASMTASGELELF